MEEPKQWFDGDTSEAPVIRNAPSSAPVISAPVIRAPVISTLSAEQQQAAERTHRYRSDTSRSTVLIPNSDNESSQDDDDSLFDDQFLPAEKNKIMRLRKEIRRIKGGVIYPTGYEAARTRAIKKADTDRIAGNPVPHYLEGTKEPWSSGMGQANRYYDDNEVAKTRGTNRKDKEIKC